MLTLSLSLSLISGLEADGLHILLGEAYSTALGVHHLQAGGVRHLQHGPWSSPPTGGDLCAQGYGLA